LLFSQRLLPDGLRRRLCTVRWLRRFQLCSVSAVCRYGSGLHLSRHVRSGDSRCRSVDSGSAGHDGSSGDAAAVGQH
jgi:hypothetical protein